jgi:hypothetical protein
MGANVFSRPREIIADFGGERLAFTQPGTAAA